MIYAGVPSLLGSGLEMFQLSGLYCIQYVRRFVSACALGYVAGSWPLSAPAQQGYRAMGHGLLSKG